jgi:hypothetical protein
MTERLKTERGPRSRMEAAEEHGFSLDEVKEWKASLEKAIHEHPILTASVAVGAGVLIARLVKDALDDEWDRKRRRRRKGGLLGSEIGRALMGSLATMAAAKLQETLLADLQQDEEEEEPEPPVRRRRPTKSPRTAGQRASSQRRRKPAVEE